MKKKIVQTNDSMLSVQGLGFRVEGLGNRSNVR